MLQPHILCNKLYQFWINFLNIRSALSLKSYTTKKILQIINCNPKKSCDSRLSLLQQLMTIDSENEIFHLSVFQRILSLLAANATGFSRVSFCSSCIDSHGSFRQGLTTCLVQSKWTIWFGPMNCTTLEIFTSLVYSCWPVLDMEYFKLWKSAQGRIVFKPNQLSEVIFSICIIYFHRFSA